MSAEVVEKNISSEVAAWIARHLPTTVTALRQKALAEFQNTGLPQHKAEEFKFTPLTRELEKNFNFSVANAPSKIDPTDFFIKGLDAYVVVFVNGVFAKEYSSTVSDDVTILTLEEAVTKMPETVATYLNNASDMKADAFAAWNTAGWGNGTFIHVAENKTIDKPILIYHVHDASQSQVLSTQRNLFVVEKNSSITVLEKFDSTGTFNHFANLVSEGFVHEHALLNFYSIQNDDGAQYQYNQKLIHQADSSRVNTFTFTLNGKLVRNNLHLSLDGENIESHMYGLYLLGKDTLADNHTVVDHKKPHSFSNELYKGIMDDRSKGVFNGKIYVRPLAQKTNAFQANRNILLGDKASVNTKPQLEIWADDVKCSHGCTSGQLDEEALFYLQSRGIKKETARGMMLYAFASELLQPVTNEPLKNYLDTIISERLHKNF